MGSVIAEYLHLDGTRVEDNIIGVGGTGIVIQQGEYAIKIPRVSRVIEVDGAPVIQGRLTPEDGDHDVRTDLVKSLENEKAIYRRLGDHHGIVRCYNPSSAHHSIRMARMANGDLRHYLAERRPERRQQLSWLREMANTIAYVHSRCVIIADVRLDNFLLDDNFSVKLFDFSESTLMPVGWNLEGTDDLGFSILTDIGQFGAVMFEIVTGQQCSFDIMQDWKEVGDESTWPRRSSLPSTSDIWLGHIIEKCWTQKFISAKDLAGELETEDTPGQ